MTKPVILISELTIATTEMAEQYKQVFAGETIFVNVKNRNAEILTRKPVILTTNQPIWRHIPQERDAFRNRCFIFDNLMTTNVISNCIRQSYVFPAHVSPDRHTYIDHEHQTRRPTKSIYTPRAQTSRQRPDRFVPLLAQPKSHDDTEEYIIITDDDLDTSNPSI